MGKGTEKDRQREESETGRHVGETLTKGKNGKNSWNHRYHVSEFRPSEGSQERELLCLWGCSLAVMGKTQQCLRVRLSEGCVNTCDGRLPQ